MRRPRAAVLVTTVAVMAATATSVGAAPLVLVDVLKVAPGQQVATRSEALESNETFTLQVYGEVHQPNTACDGRTCTNAYGTLDPLYCYGSAAGADQYNKPCGKPGAAPKPNPGVVFAAGPEGRTHPVPPAGLDEFGGGTLGSIPFAANHFYSSKFHTTRERARQRLLGYSQCQGCTGGFTVRILTEADGQSVRFSFASDNAIDAAGHTRVTMSGAGRLRLLDVVDDQDAGEYTRAAASSPATLKLAVERVDGEDHHVELGLGDRVRYVFREATKGVLETLVADVVVKKSDDPECHVNDDAILTLTEVKSGAGKIQLDGFCSGYARVLRERFPGDKVRVTIRGPGPTVVGYRG
jgi:hypothetical protein